MNPITSADFRSNNEILFQSRILVKSKIPAHTGRNYSVNCEGSSCKVGDFDVIDLNKNGKADKEYQRTGFITYKMKFTEPSLAHRFEKIKEYAVRNKTEVLTQDDLRDPLIETAGIDTGTSIFSKTTEIHENQHALGTLVEQIEPFEQNAKWAIDVTTQEFMLFKSK